MDAHVIGGGLAGSEAAWQLAERGVSVVLHEMRPVRPTSAHKTDRLGELVCSNSLGSDTWGSAPALLKAEMRKLGSLVLQAAEDARVPAGSALAVDRDVFGESITRRLQEHPNVRIVREECLALQGPVILATGPLTSSALAERLRQLLGRDHLHFFDAAAPIVSRDSLDESKLFAASRYGKGEGVYLNAPLDKGQYEQFWEALCAAENTVLHLQEEREVNFFEGCLPVEVLARRGKDTLRYGPMKPVGLVDPKTERRPWAVVQLRQDNVAGDLFNMVGFQTQLKWGEQKRVFSMIPGLEQAEFVRLGVMHKNTFLAAPTFLEPSLRWHGKPDWFAAGTLIGVEGYTEAAATGLLAGLNLARVLAGREPLVLPPSTMLGALARYVSSCDPDHFQPINSNWGLVEPLAETIRDKRQRHEQLAHRSLADLDSLCLDSGEPALAIRASAG
ncbi:MAG: methylenetetrahydrofolate--tRNA-(uracil(54)-C(5))-methyltransferase (FADH(2)-oxidizing) TrmFO [Cyanobacteria bacterium REEB65]|nr:methylenetetrahydrofolate--tRNA-(uracil(54)-C(5))-methyltransferase (FADH(2)-oxidizing) TrmFO [Cyanobacteria bacterium REEB65]